jgi:hypothetical protein
MFQEVEKNLLNCCCLHHISLNCGDSKDSAANGATRTIWLATTGLDVPCLLCLRNHEVNESPLQLSYFLSHDLVSF